MKLPNRDQSNHLLSNMGLLLIIAIPLLNVIISLSTSGENKIYNSSLKGLRKLTKYGYITFFLNVLLIIFIIIQENIKDSEVNNNKVELQKYQLYRDSLLKASYDSSLLEMKNKFDVSQLKYTDLISDNLGKYGFQLDSTNIEIVKIIKDSTNIKTILPLEPVLFFSEEPMFYRYSKNTSDVYGIKLVSYDASSHIDEIRFALLMSNELYSGDIEYIYSQKIDFASSIFISGFEQTHSILVPTFEDLNLIYVAVKGRYMNINKTKSYNIESVLFYDKIKGKSGFITGKSRERILNEVKKSDSFF